MIKRYNLPLTSPDCMQPNDAGEYVRHEDHAAEVERLSTEGLHHVALILAAHNALPDLIAELRTLRARVAGMERDARLGAAVRSVIATGGVGSDEPDQLDGYAQSLEDDRSMFGAAVIRAIADALRAEEGGSDAG